jgi:hypothetical protein
MHIYSLSAEYLVSPYLTSHTIMTIHTSHSQLLIHIYNSDSLRELHDTFYYLNMPTLFFKYRLTGGGWVYSVEKQVFYFTTHQPIP